GHLAPGPLLGVEGVQPLAGAKAVVGLAVRHQLFGILLEQAHPLALDIGAHRAAHIGALVPQQAGLPAGVVDHVHRTLHIALLVGVLDAQDEGAPGVLGRQVGVQGGAQVAHVHVPRGGRGEAGTYFLFHGLSPLSAGCKTAFSHKELCPDRGACRPAWTFRYIVYPLGGRLSIIPGGKWRFPLDKTIIDEYNSTRSRDGAASACAGRQLFTQPQDPVSRKDAGFFVARRVFGKRRTIQMKKMKALALGLAAVMLAGLTACGGSTAASDVPDGDGDPSTLTVAMECAYAPYNWTQTDDSNGAVQIRDSSDYAYGYDVMMAKKIAEALGQEVQIVKLDWDSLVPAVKSGDVDCVIAGQSITSERAQQVD